MSKKKCTSFPYTLVSEGTKISVSSEELLSLGYKFLEIDQETNQLVFSESIDDVCLITGNIFQYLRSKDDGGIILIISVPDGGMVFLQVPEQIVSNIEFDC